MSEPYNTPFNPYQPPQSPGSYGGPPAPPPRSPSGPIVASAVVSFVYGGLALTCGAAWACLGTALGSALGFAASQDTGPQSDAFRGFAMAAGGVVIAYGAINLLAGGMAIGAGAGVLKRRRWGRILSLVVAGTAILLTAVALVLLFAAGDVVTSCFAFLAHLGYAITTLILLLLPRVAEEFS